MTTATTNTPINHADDAGFRAWGSELSGMLADVGLVQTADTGQINWATVTRPGTNTAAGYEIWRFDDALQATAPVFLKVEYGTGNGTTTAGVWITPGTGSDGAGGITGATTGRTDINPGSNVNTAAGNWPSYACHTDGFFGIAFKAGVGTNSAATVAAFISRPLDDAGTVLGEGLCVVVPGNSSSTRVRAAAVSFGSLVRFPTSGTSSDIAMVPMSVAASLVDTDVQVVRNVAPFPRFRTLVGVFSYLRAEIAQGTALDVALEGVTSRTYLTLGTYAPYATNQATDGYSHAMLWQ